MVSLACKDMGMDCPMVIKGSDRQEVMTKAMDHAKKDHGLSDADMTPEMTKKMESAMKEM